MLTSTRLSGDILHSEIIGRNTRDLVRSSRGANLRVYLPYVFSESSFPLLNQMLSLETCLGCICCLGVFQGSRIPSNKQD